MKRHSPHLFVSLVFTGVLLSAGGIQLGVDWRQGKSPPLLALFTKTPSAARLRAYEKDLERESWLAGRLRPWMQYLQFILLHDAGDKALRGRNGWFFYRPGVEYLTQRNTTRPGSGDPVSAIRDFRDRLAARGVHLVVVPVPNKESVYPEQLSRRAARLSSAMCDQTRSVLRRLEVAGVEVVDLFDAYARAKAALAPGQEPRLYLAQDSHWSPAGLELAARTVARRLRERGWIRPGNTTYQEQTVRLERFGDVVQMLNVPQIEARLMPEPVTCAQVLLPDSLTPYQDDSNAEILVLGDSFLRIFQQDEPGSAGFIARLAAALGQPVASLVNDGGGSTLVRQDFQRRPALLQHTRVVIWEFVERDIRFGAEGWQTVPLPSPVPNPSNEVEHLNVRFSWGHQSAIARPFHIGFLSGRVAVSQLRPERLEPGDTLRDRVCASRAGAGDVDAVTVELSWTGPTKSPRPVHSIWQFLLDHGEPGQVARLRDDPGLQPDAPVLTVLTAPDATEGFSIGLEQLARHRAMWLPEHDVWVSVVDAPLEFAAHLASLPGRRVLDRTKDEPEATLAEWRGKWADFGNPDQPNHGHETSWLGAKGHLTGFVARHGSIYKFGVDRWARVRPDHASPHKFRFDPLWPDLEWKEQRIVNGLPVLVTSLEGNTNRFEVEQFAAPFGDVLPEQRGEAASLFFTRIRIAGAGPVSLGFRLATESKERHPELRELAGRWCVTDRETGSVWLMIEPDKHLTIEPRAPIADDQDPRLEFDCVGQVAADQSSELVFKLASPVVAAGAAARLAALDASQARAATVRYWEEWLSRGAQFEVPERAVNDLFRANLWHALLLPRHRTDEKGVPRIDLPYSNFAYGQLNADWPINQAVYVDYMIHGLRGNFAVAEEEFAAMYQAQQQPDGRVAGYANWGVNTPGMLYSIGQNFLLSGDRASFERLLPSSLKALDWCLGEIARSREHQEAPGLIIAPLNDLSKESRAWAFPNAYFVAGLDTFAHALSACQHPRAAEVAQVAGRMRVDVARAFARASVRSPVVQLADGTWNNYVPCDAMTPRRLLDQWYPADVDTGPLHLARLGAIDPTGRLATAMLHDHEDNLFLNQWGMANEPVYNQQAAAYLWRDEPEAAIRAFYSMLACAFSHGQLTPLEHRWAWGQYYMPPSTDGAWFELYRNMLLRETGDGALLLCQAAPRSWFADGREIRVDRAPTYFGPVSFTVASRAADGEIAVTVQPPDRQRPKALLARLRHPTHKPIRSVRVNDVDWQDFSPAKEWVRIPAPAAERYRIVALYGRPGSASTGARENRMAPERHPHLAADTAPR